MSTSIIKATKGTTQNEQSILKTDQIFEEISTFLATHDFAEFLIHEDPLQLNSLMIEFVGRKGSLHEGARYFVQMIISANYPTEKPQCKCCGMIPYHCNVYENGNICIDYLNGWKPDYSALQLILHLNHLWYSPNPNSAARRVCKLTDGNKERECREWAAKSKGNNLKNVVQGG